MEVGGLLKGEPVEAWMSFEGSEFLVRYVPLSERDELRRRCKTRTAGAFGVREKDDDEGRDRFRILLGRATVRDWRGVTSGGEPVPFSQANLDRALTEIDAFVAWVIQAGNDLAAIVEAAKEQARGN